MTKATADILHIVLTRFNLPSKGRERKLRQSSAWLDERFTLFESVCLPSMAAQTSQDFLWLVFFDSQTSDAHQARAKNMVKAHKNIRLIWLRGSLHSAINSIIDEVAEKQTKTLITTRLDNDDALNKNFIHHIHRIQSTIPINESRIVNFDNGIVFSNGRAYEHRDTSNAFTTLVEPFSSNNNTIWKKQHTRLSELADIINIEQPAMWLQVIHNRNISNRVRGYRVNNQVVAQNFSTDLTPLPEEKNLPIKIENVILYPLRCFKEWGRGKLKLAYQLFRSY
ncbi:hypothetical protein NBRC116583_10890 [Arenicella sp. 4NH20-0111]|uniref:glycosyltransferase n=1 Tax=Arenicella sp. 4NH20-0111 TaxID=3127648 RepID=UPI00310C3459